VLDDTALAEICQPESVSWSLCGPHVSIGWVRRDLEVEEIEDAANMSGGGTILTSRDTTGHVIVCNATNRRASITVYYPPQLASFFLDGSLLGAFEPGGFLGSKLAADVGEIRFLEWRQGSVRVPCILPTWMAFMLWDLVRRGDEEVLHALCGHGPHVLRAVEMDGWAIGKEVGGWAVGREMGRDYEAASVRAMPSEATVPCISQALKDLLLDSGGDAHAPDARTLAADRRPPVAARAAGSCEWVQCTKSSGAVRSGMRGACGRLPQASDTPLQAACQAPTLTCAG